MLLSMEQFMLERNFTEQTALSPLGDIPLQVQENDGIKLLLVNMLKNGLELL
ncbi:Uncharacterised protein [Mycobacterium tuberculosis]|nr:Uncharacterised protein [Mycobacterium tuberculosis]